MKASRTLQRLQLEGYRATPQRSAVVRALCVLPSPTVPELLELCPRVGIVTVYRTLALLRELGLVQRLYPGGEARYALRPQSGHAGRFVCESCGLVQELAALDSEAARTLLSELASGARPGWIEVYGDCAECVTDYPEYTERRARPAWPEISNA